MAGGGPRQGLRPRVRVLLTAALVAVLLTIVAVGSSASGGRAGAALQAATADISATVGQARSGRPNIVVVMTDDQRAADMKYLPKTRRLIGRSGVTFTDSLSPHPLCCPARAMFLSGGYAQNNKVRSNVGRYGGYHRLDVRHTVATWLDKAGYQTAMFGKHLNGYRWSVDGRDPGWSVFSPISLGVYNYSGSGIVEGNRVVKRRQYITDYIADRSVRAVRSFSASRKPFFMWVAHVAPHDAYYAKCDCFGPPKSAPRHKDLYRHEPLDSMDKPSYLEHDVSDKPAIAQRRPPRGAALAPWVREHRSRLRSLAAVDEATARLVRALRDTGELGNTVLVFTSDNGYLLGEHHLGGKILGYEESLQVPLLVSGPGIAQGAESDETVTTLDLTATIAALANARPKLPLDGRSLLPILRDPGDRHPLRDTVLIQGGPRWRGEDRLGWLYRGVRTNRYTFIRYGNGALELYDRLVDPFQLENVAGDASYEPVQDELLERLRRLRSCQGGSDCNVMFGSVPEPL